MVFASRLVGSGQYVVGSKSLFCRFCMCLECVSNACKEDRKEKKT